VASWLVKRLLDKGYTVHATVRDPENEAKVRHLLDIPGAAERLKLFKAELSEDGSFDAAIDSCDGVFHVATPVDVAPKDPENDVIKPAVEGTLNVMRACTKAQTVKRVVVTSSATTITQSAEHKEHIDESCWTDVDSVRIQKTPNWPYVVSKTLAEQAALQYGKEHDLDVVTIIPVVIVGSSITPSVPISFHLALAPLTGNPQLGQALKDLEMLSGGIQLVHVDDLCSAHIFLMENPSAEGRYICCTVNTSVPRLAHYLSKRYPQYHVPTHSRFEDMPESSKMNVSSKKLLESGFSFRFGIDEMYDDIVEYFKNKGLLVN